MNSNMYDCGWNDTVYGLSCNKRDLEEYVRAIRKVGKNNHSPYLSGAIDCIAEWERLESIPEKK